MRLPKFIITLVFLFFVFTQGYTQQTAVVFGKVYNEIDKEISQVSISIEGTSIGTFSDNLGNFRIEVPANKKIVITFKSIGFETQKVNVILKVAEEKDLTLKMKVASFNLKEATITEKESRNSGITRIDPKIVGALPNAGGSFESILKTLPGVSSNNELSSQYNVRGGNYDENLVYVNDFEIYRPLLVRAGQQEGLSFINSDMVAGVKFSGGGFEPKYGDKLSSVLDITYKKPKSFGGNVAAGFQGLSFNLEGASKNYKTTYLFGARQRSNQFLLNSLDTKGEYKPSFIDIQGYVTRMLNEKWELAFLGNYSSNKYELKPQDRESTFGTIKEILRLRVVFEGQEIDRFQTLMGGVSTMYTNKNLRLKFLSSYFRINENETFDIEGAYLFDELENDFGKSTFGEVIANRGIGSFINHARNYLTANVANVEHKGSMESGKNLFSWGARFQVEDIDDRLNEWKLVDSAGYAIPENDNQIILQDVYRSRNSVLSNRTSVYFQDTYSFSDSTISSITFGARGSYWDLNGELLFSPRATYAWKPRYWKRDFLFRVSAGVYYQPPFYREFRNLNGSLNKNIKAQRSIHYVLAGDYNLTIFNKPFKLIGEFYYKQLDNLIPYEIDNVRIRYYATNNSKGYAAGADFKLNGEFVEGLESWFTLSFLKTEEDLNDDFFIRDVDSVTTERVEPGFIPRPTDQRVNFSIFFQDKLLKDPSYKVHLNLIYGGRLPIGPPDFTRYKDVLRVPAYRRVDIGFSKDFIGKRSGEKQNAKIGKFKSVVLYAEVFNLLQIQNTISFLWIKDVENTQYAIPNFLTKRQLNLRLTANF